MSNIKFIISRRNQHKCNPDTFYYCSGANSTGTQPHTRQGTIWDPNPDKSHIFHSVETTAATLEKLKALNVKDLMVQQRIITYEPADIEMFNEFMTKNKIRKIIDALDDSDVDLLVKHANLDLTIVT